MPFVFVRNSRGELRFDKEEYLTAQQIQGQWSKLHRCQKETIPIEQCNTHVEEEEGEQEEDGDVQAQYYLENPILEIPADAYEIARDAIDTQTCDSGREWLMLDFW